MNSAADRSGYNLSHNAAGALFADHHHTSHHVSPHDMTSSLHNQSRVSSYGMSNQPLVALHNMADGMKAPATGAAAAGAPVFSPPSPSQYHNQNGGGGGGGVCVSTGGGGAGGVFDSLKNLSTTSSSSSSAASLMAGTPHGISDIPRASMAGLSPLGLNSNMHIANYLNSSAGRYPKPVADLPGRSPVYWPSGMLNPAWRGSQGA